MTQEGQAIADINEFREYLAGQDERLARKLTERFLTFATGAGVSFADRAIVETILRETKDDGYPIRSLLEGVVRSYTFGSK